MDEEDSPTLLDYLDLGSRTATGVLGALKQPKPKTPATNNWGLIAGIGAAVVGVLLLVLVVSKK